jgi:hypothetical protein
MKKNINPTRVNGSCAMIGKRAFEKSMDLWVLFAHVLYHQIQSELRGNGCRSFKMRRELRIQSSFTEALRGSFAHQNLTSFCSNSPKLAGSRSAFKRPASTNRTLSTRTDPASPHSPHSPGLLRPSSVCAFDYLMSSMASSNLKRSS